MFCMCYYIAYVVYVLLYSLCFVCVTIHGREMERREMDGREMDRHEMDGYDMCHTYALIYQVFTIFDEIRQT